MLKPLLRTIPTLSGNVKIACSLSDYDKEGLTDYSCYVRYARLLPLSSQMSQRNIETNLLYSTYDFDLQRYFKHYSNYFYDDLFDYDKKNYILIDDTLCQKNRNTDFEFGCKRISYQKNGAQYAFYTPIYLESVNDLPDYFLIHIILRNNKYEIERNIKVNISSKLSKNYLYVYLKNYLSKIDGNVIFCNSKGLQATYYGIDLINGGTTKTVDNIIAKTFVNQNTINNFDAIITNGFKRNQLAIRQILPLCWYFNVNDILTADEKNIFKNSEVYISGNWYKDGKRLSFYDIDMNYQYYYENPLLINKSNGIFSYKSTLNNIMNMDYPSLNDSMYMGYRYSNKLNKKYNRWKLKYSDDEHPYIANLSPAFSINQGSSYKYREFPEKYTPIRLISENQNVILPIGNALKIQESPYYNNYTLINNYYNILNNNVSNWYTLTDNLTDIYQRDIWKETEDNRVYYKGILYDFTKIYDEYPNIMDTIDKFSVIVNLHFNTVNKSDLNNIKRADVSLFNSNKYMTDRTAWISPDVKTAMSKGTFSSLYNFYDMYSSFGKGNSQIVFDKLYIPDKSGDFIDMSSLGYNIEDVNKYYKYGDILSVFNINNSFPDSIYEILKDYNTSSMWINGYELLDISYLNNILHENERDIIFENKNAEWLLLNHIYFSQKGNYYKTPYDRDTFSVLIKQYGDEKNIIPVYFNTKFISAKDFLDILHSKYNSNIYDNLAKTLSVYEYQPRVKDDEGKSYTADVFVKKYKNDNNDNIYVDTYNLQNVINDYNSRFGTDISINLNSTETFYAKFLNMKHILFYISDLYKDSLSREDLHRLYNSLYIRQRVCISNGLDVNLNIYDQYIHISKLYDNYRKLTVDEKINILRYGGIFNHLGIYRKNKNQYSRTTYTRVNCGELISAGNDTYVLNIFTDNNGHGEYHDEDFYYIPEFYMKQAGKLDDNGDITYNYIPLEDYIKKEVSYFDESISNYINKDIISKLEKYEIDDIDLNSLDIEGVRKGLEKIGFIKTNSINGKNIKDILKTIQSYIKRLLPYIQKNIYYKVYEDSDEYEKFNNYTGINDFILLDNIDIKEKIIKGEINLRTYVIDETDRFIEKDYNEDYYTDRNIEDEDYDDFIKDILSSFPSDIEYYPQNNYYKFSKAYLYNNDIDSLLNIVDYDTEFKSRFTFEVVYKKDDFIKLDESLFELINLTDNEKPYKDLYLYTIYDKSDFPSTLKINYYDKDPLLGELSDLSLCLIPMFDDIFIQDKKYTVIYSEYNQSNIFKYNENYKYNLTNIKYMYDISGDPEDMEYIISGQKYYKYSYWNKLKDAGSNEINTHSYLRAYKLINSCYCLNSNICDDLNIYDKYNINTYIYKHTYSYTYSYTQSDVNISYAGKTSYTVIDTQEYVGIGYNTENITYGFMLFDIYADNTTTSFNIVDKKYKPVKYFTYINEHNIYDENFNILDTFNLMLPASKLNLLENLFALDDVIVYPQRYVINTYYKQTPVNDTAGNTYAYNINLRNSHIDTFILQRYFNSIVPYIKETNTLDSTYCLKYKNYKYATDDIHYTKDIFYSENVNIYNYNKLRVYDSNNSYTLYEPLEYKHLNDNKMINLPTQFELKEPGTFTYNELLEKEKDEYVFEKFKKYLLIDKLNTYKDNEILFLFNRYGVEYDAECIGLNFNKTEKIYTLTYKFKLL